MDSIGAPIRLDPFGQRKSQHKLLVLAELWKHNKTEGRAEINKHKTHTFIYKNEQN